MLPLLVMFLFLAFVVAAAASTGSWRVGGPALFLLVLTGIALGGAALGSRRERAGHVEEDDPLGFPVNHRPGDVDNGSGDQPAGGGYR